MQNNKNNNENINNTNFCDTEQLRNHEMMEFDEYE